MLKHNLLIFLRTLTKYKSNSFITVSGLAIGLLFVLLAYTNIYDEIGFDQFHTKKDRLFRISKINKDPSGDISKNAETPGLMASALVSELPEVEAAARICPWFDEVLVSVDNQNIKIKNWMFADSNFFKLFDFKLLSGGNFRTVLMHPGQVLLTPSIAKSLFGEGNPIGKKFIGLDNKLFTVSGLVQEPPRQSHIQYDIIASWISTHGNEGLFDFDFMNNWLGQTAYTYALLYQKEQKDIVINKLTTITQKYMPNRIEMYEFFLQPFKDIYLYSNDYRFLRGGKYGSISFIKMFSFIALLTLIIACFNYINITTARFLARSKEVGIKKVLGISKFQIVKQFWLETFLTILGSAIISFLLAFIVLPVLNGWFQKEIPQAEMIQPYVFGFLALTVIAISILTGLVPGFLLSGFLPMQVLRDRIVSSHNLLKIGQLPRQFLTIFQLTISVGLIACSFVIIKQFQYLMKKDLGLAKDQVLVMETPAGIDSNSTAFAHEVRALSGVQNLAISGSSIPEGSFGSTVIPQGSTSETMVQMFRIDSNYLNTYGIQIVEGRNLSTIADLVEGNRIVNEAFVRQMGWNQGVGKTLKFPSDDRIYTIVGVVQDFYYNSLHQQIAPSILYLSQRKNHISIRADPDRLISLLPLLNNLWKKYEMRIPFDYYFLDDQFALFYNKEKIMVKIVSVFAGVAVFIALIGIYGLTSFTSNQRQKEIGIRKVFGATIFSILGLLTKNFIFIVLVSISLATPIVWILLNKWLQQFAYHIDLSPWIFAVSGLLLLFIVLITVSIQSIRVISTNAIQSLK